MADAGGEQFAGAADIGGGEGVHQEHHAKLVSHWPHLNNVWRVPRSRYPPAHAGPSLHQQLARCNINSLH